MLSKKQGEDTSVRTVALARGSFSGTGQSSVSGSIQTQKSFDRPGFPKNASAESLKRKLAENIPGHAVIFELLDQDDRPTFVIDALEPLGTETKSLKILFANTSLRARPGLLDALLRSSTHPHLKLDLALSNHYQEFKTWLCGASRLVGTPGIVRPSFSYEGVIWAYSTLQKRLRVVNAVPLMTMSPGPREGLFDGGPASDQWRGRLGMHHGTGVKGSKLFEARDYFSVGVSLKSPDSADERDERDARGLITDATKDLDKEEVFFDWTQLPISASLPPHIHFARSMNWASTSLGPIEDWPSDLRQLCNLIMASPHPAAMYWGDDHVAIYNEAYVMLAGKKHPWLMGQKYREAWAEIWDEVKDIFANAKSTGEAIMKVGSHIINFGLI